MVFTKLASLGNTASQNRDSFHACCPFQITDSTICQHWLMFVKDNLTVFDLSAASVTSMTSTHPMLTTVAVNTLSTVVNPVVMVLFMDKFMTATTTSTVNLVNLLHVVTAEVLLLLLLVRNDMNSNG